LKRFERHAKALYFPPRPGKSKRVCTIAVPPPSSATASATSPPIMWFITTSP